MSDKTFEVSLCVLTAAALIWMIAGIVLGAVGLPWAAVDLGALVFLTVLIGLVVEIVGGGALLYFWGKNYMARG